MAGAPIGNTNAKGKRVWSDAIRKHAVQNGTLDQAAKVLCDLAVQGDLAAIKELGDRIDGKSVQALANDDDSPLFPQKVLVELVNAANKDT